MKQPYLRHLVSHDSLTTTPVSMSALLSRAAIEDRRARSQLETNARTLWFEAQQASTARDLVFLTGIEGGLLMAAGVKREIALRLSPTRRRQIVAEFVEDVLVPNAAGFVDALVANFVHQSHLHGEASVPRPMRAWTQRMFAQAVTSDLRIAGRPFWWLRKGGARWQSQEALWDCTYVEALAWAVGDQPRVLAFDLLVPLIQPEAKSNAVQGHDVTRNGNNVDICLLHSAPEQYRSKTQRPKVVHDAETYVALGELKGGIDPAGADEHWKTANAHLGRIRRSFAALPAMPQLFFVGNAIEASMAGEIWNQLENGDLSNAANLTDDRQAVSLVSWLCSL